MFIETESGDLLNASEIARVARVQRRIGAGIGEEFYAITRDGMRFEIAHYEAARLACEGALLPARPGDTGLLLTLFIEDGKVDHLLDEVPIVGWRIVGARDDHVVALPIVPQEITRDQRIGIELTGGDVLACGDAIYGTREEFVRTFATLFTDDHERKREKAA